MVILKKRLAALVLGGAVLGVVVIAQTSPSYAQRAGREISGARAAAIHECNLLAEQYPENDWGITEIYQYRACMAEHDEPE
jgi:hypothetical protein